jgi:hypothetical protein
VPAATDGLKEPETTGAGAGAGVVAVAAAGGAGLAGFTGFSAGIAGTVAVGVGVGVGDVTAGVVVVTGVVGAAGDTGEAAVALAAVAAGLLAGAPGTTGGVGLAGFFPCRAVFGSQSLFFFSSVASDSLVWACPLLLKGDGVLVTKTATTKAAANPSTTPIISPRIVPPRCCFIVKFFIVSP